MSRIYSVFSAAGSAAVVVSVVAAGASLVASAVAAEGSEVSASEEVQRVCFGSALPCLSTITVQDTRLSLNSCMIRVESL